MAVKKLAKKSKASVKKIAVKSKAKVKAKVATKAKPVVSKAKAKAKVVKKVIKKPATKTLEKITKPLTKSELFNLISDSVEVNRKQVVAVFDKLAAVIAMHLKKDGPEKFVLPGMLKIVVRKVPARPARQGKNPFTGETIMFKAKPASKKVKVLALRALKEMC